MHARTALVLLVTLSSHVFAECLMKNEPGGLIGSKDGGKTVTENEKVCGGQGEGSWLFVMQTSGVDVPSGSAGGIAGGYAGGTVFAILGHSCIVHGLFNKPDDCGIPYTIREDWLPHHLTIDRINASVGGAHFKFTYADKEYEINKHQCACYDVSDGLKGAQSCRCAFPKNGIAPDKRDLVDALVGLPFEA